MKRLALAILFLVWTVAAALAQNVTVIGPVTPGDCSVFSSPTVIKDAGFGCPSGGIAVPYTNITGVPANSFLGNNTGSPAAAIGLTPAQAAALLPGCSAGAVGTVPATGGGTSNFLRADCTFAPGIGGRTLLSTNTTFFVRTVPVAVTISNASPAVITQTQSYGAGQLVTFNSTATLPTGLTAGTIYCVLAAGLSGSSYEVGATCGGAAINTSSAGSGTFTVQAGNDATGTGASQTATSAFMTPQGAVNWIQQNIDFGNTTATIQLACAGGGGVALYAQGLEVAAPFVGGSMTSLPPQVTISGDTTTPANCIWNPAVNTPGAAVVGGWNNAQFGIQGVTLENNNVGENGILADSGANIWIVGNMAFVGGNTSTNTAHLQSRTLSKLICSSGYTIGAGSEWAHWFVQESGYIECPNVTITITGTPSFVTFAVSVDQSHLFLVGDTFVGSATGPRYLAQLGGVINTNAAGLTYLPGNAAGIPAAADTWATSGANCCGLYN